MRRPTVVVDASAVVGVLQAGEPAEWLATTLHRRSLVAPRLMPFEAGNVLRRLHLSGHLDASAATLAHDELTNASIRLWPHRPLAARAWELRDTLSYYDAAYIALAELLEAPLVTLDRRLARAPGTRCTFLLPPEV
ncbi:MAG: type II toxin-antitoxin system VapC family toxin [Pseudonocardia sp.]|nr:type II toxin-antitoxin system VapC family toxin [Pseudonocardia sp.]